MPSANPVKRGAVRPEKQQNGIGIRFYVKQKTRRKRRDTCDELVTRRGFEPRTHCLKGSCSAD